MPHFSSFWDRPTTRRRCSGTAPRRLRSFSCCTSKSDIILGINDYAKRMRPLTMRSLRMALTSNLVAFRPGEILLFPITRTPPKANIPETIRSMMTAAHKLGFWCAHLSLYEVSIILQVT
ncbi:MAG: three component ABC system middle component [Janthinobacterium lividum]